MKNIWKVMAGIGLVMLCVCARGAAQETPVPDAVEVTGKLVKVMAVGGETTGWEIEFEKEVSFGGNGVHWIEVEGDAKKFEKL